MTFFKLGRRGKAGVAGRFLKDERGVAAIEFFFIFPIMLAILFGTVQFTAAFAAMRKLTVVSRTMSDLISQAINVCSADVDNALTVGKAVMSPYPTTGMGTTISEVYINPNTHAAQVVWSRGTKPRALNSVVTVPSGIAVDGRYLIMSEVTYTFTPSVGFDIENNFQSVAFPMSRTSFTAPRQTPSVTYAATCS